MSTGNRQGRSARGSAADAGAGTGAAAGAPARTGAGTGPVAAAGPRPRTGAGTGSGVGSTGADTGTRTRPGSDVGSDSGSGTDYASGTGSGSGTGTGTGTGVGTTGSGSGSASRSRPRTRPATVAAARATPAAVTVALGAAEAGPPATVLVRIRGLLPTLPPSERRVAEAAIADPAGVAAKTISELASDCDTSETTVIRFCRAVGLKGYPELRIGLAAAAGIEDAAASAPTVGGDIGPRDSLSDVVAKLGYADARAVEDTVAQLDLHLLERAVDAVVSAGAVDIYGIGASALIAADLHQKLHRIGHRAAAWPDAENALTSAALLGRGDVAIGISHTGATPATVTALAEAHDNGARTIAITNFPRSPITDVADLVLTTAVRETTFRSGAMASRIAALTVVDCLFVGVAQRNFSRTTRALERTRSAVQGARGR